MLRNADGDGPHPGSVTFSGKQRYKVVTFNVTSVTTYEWVGGGSNFQGKQALRNT